MLDQGRVQLGPFHLSQLAAHHFIFGYCVTCEVDRADINTLTGLNVNIQGDFLGFIIDLRESLHLWIGVTEAAQILTVHLFGKGHIGAVVLLTGLDRQDSLEQLFAAHEFTSQVDFLNLILLAFIDVNGDVEALTIRRHSHLSRGHLETNITIIVVVGLDSFEVGLQLLFLITALAEQIPPSHIVFELQHTDKVGIAETLIPHYVDLTDFGR